MSNDQGISTALLSFACSNVRSYADELHFSLLSSRLSEPEVVREVETAGTTTPVLPVVGIFGANASGKSTLLRAMADMREHVLTSYREGTTESVIPRRPFLLDPIRRREPSWFEIDLVIRGVRWQYRFEFDDHRVLNEHAYHFPKGRQKLVFERQSDVIKHGDSFKKDGRLFENLLRPNALFLSVAGLVGRSELLPLFMWFNTNLLLAESDNRHLRSLRTADLGRNESTRDRVLGLLQAGDFGVTDISRQPIPAELRDRLERAFDLVDPDSTEDEQIRLFVADDLKLSHAADAGAVELSASDESLGTTVWVGLIGPILDVLAGGNVLLADELDASLHPHLVDHVIELFQNPVTNPNSAQLIFNAHDVTVLGDSERRRLGRDQIWFTEKDGSGMTTAYPLSDFKPRKDEALEKRYLNGRFGGIPIIDDGEFVAAVSSSDK